MMEAPTFMDAVETGMTVPPPYSGAQGTSASESEDDPMLVDEQAHKTESKRTYYARKDEIRKLKAELSALTERMEQIQQIKQQNDDALMQMSAMSAFNSPLSLQGMTTSESEDDPMGMEEDTSKKKTKPTYTRGE
ncbi:hypothetical protein Poli38472_012355 [Pythium oligandrum]|uniref:Uncharacterized protein n=1 Tax=Pythium oligandrum TaxID=41045 RepID=A0A8K1CPI8_PYTOL|nr:hypothetical protein Poli38472_012355 [Pythium oligandrum]|eukprot:TMW67239.1 hypothetical protein Poli38472_012355 [Pythium oligandrum]